MRGTLVLRGAGSFIAGYGVASLTFGHLVHAYPPFRLMFLGLCVWMGSIVLSGLAPNYYILVLARVFRCAAWPRVGGGRLWLIRPPTSPSAAGWARPPSRRWRRPSSMTMRRLTRRLSGSPSSSWVRWRQGQHPPGGGRAPNRPLLARTHQPSRWGPLSALPTAPSWPPRVASTWGGGPPSCTRSPPWCRWR